MSLRNRFNGQTQEILEYTEVFGRWEAMKKYHVSMEAFDRWLLSEGKDEDFGNIPKLNQVDKSLGEQLLEAVISKVAREEAKNTKLTERIALLERQLDFIRENRHRKSQEQALNLYQLCKV